MQPTRAPEVILFDLGGVLVRWEGIEPLMDLSLGRLSREEARRFWLESPSVRRFEKGQCTPWEFALGVLEELDLPGSPGEFLAAFASWDRGPLPGAVELLDELAPRFLLACLSNNNPIHWSRLRDELGLGRKFRKCYLSHETGLFKPEREAFKHVLEDLGVPAAKVLFLDDSPECVKAAREAGLEAHEAHGVEGVRAILSVRGILARQD